MLVPYHYYGTAIPNFRFGGTNNFYPCMLVQYYGTDIPSIGGGVKYWTQRRLWITYPAIAPQSPRHYRTETAVRQDEV